MIGIDFVTGLIYAWASRTFQSSKMRTGLSKKAGELAILVVGEALSVALCLPKYIMAGVSIYIVIMELMSIFENLDRMGVPVPKAIRNVVNNTATTLTEKDYKEIAEQAVRINEEIKDISEEEEAKE
jgi:toxin secretion/phage lysis holin